MSELWFYKKEGMSANNYILIDRLKGKFVLFDVDMDGCGRFQIKDDVETLKEAWRDAEEYSDEYGCEYGIRISKRVKENL